METAPRRRTVSIVASLLIAAAAAADDGRLPGREIMLPRGEVWDTFLGYLVGLVEHDAVARLDQEYLLGILFEIRGSDGFRRIREVAWMRGADPGSRRLSFTFDGELHYPMPLDILGYHPGSIDTSQTIVLRRQPRDGVLAGGIFHWFTIEQGYAQVDFDEWLDVLAGPLLDDFLLAGVALFTHRDRWHAMLVGRGVRGQAVPWAFNLAGPRILFPIPRELANLAERLLRDQ